MPHPLHPAVGVGEGALLLQEAGCRQDHVGKGGGLVFQDVLDDEEGQALKLPGSDSSAFTTRYLGAPPGPRPAF